MTSPSGLPVIPFSLHSNTAIRDNNNTEAQPSHHIKTPISGMAETPGSNITKALPPRIRNATQYAFFFDLDGTLAPIVERPEQASVPASTRHLLAELQRQSGGAVAIISGRAAKQIDIMTHPLRLPLSGLHGAQWRGANGQLHEVELPEGQISALYQQLTEIANRHPGTMVEHKGLSVALHYRTAPQHADSVNAMATQLATRFGNVFELQTGKMVVEFKPPGVDKGQALQRFMGEPIFCGRTPVMAGDDTTDESAFEVANRHGGITIRIGPGSTSARYRLSSPEALAQWMASLLGDKRKGGAS